MISTGPDSGYELTNRELLLEQLQGLSITILKAATAAMSIRSPETATWVEELAGGHLGFSGPDVPLTRAVGVGTSGPIDIAAVEAIETFYRLRSAPVRMVISERTNPILPEMLRKRGYESEGYMQNWWLPLQSRPELPISGEIEVFPAELDQAEQWARTVAAGFEEEQFPVDEKKIPERIVDTFYCLGFADGARPFFAKREGVIMGGAVLHVTAQAASMRTTSCRIEHRNQGVQRALLAFRLAAAAKAGCRYAFSSTDQPGPSSRNLSRFGFHKLSTSFTMTDCH